MKVISDLSVEPQLWIDGAWTESIGHGDPLPVYNPATGDILATTPPATPVDVDRAVAGALSAGKKWARTSAVERGRILCRTAELLEERGDELARLLTAEQGKPYPQSLGEVQYAASFFRWFGEEARRLTGRVVPHPDATREFFIEQRPIGVAGMITPWNFPLAQGAKKLSAALAAGCSAVWKPSEFTPLIALALGPLLQKAGLPDGAVQIIVGSGDDVGSSITAHPEISVISVTGSVRTGRTVMSGAAARVKRVSLELGGNAPFIVLPDADLEVAADELVRLKLLVSGQVCVTANRVFVPSRLKERYVALVERKLMAARIGNGLSDGVSAGPLIHHDACRGVESLVDEAVAAGAEVVCRNESFREETGTKAGSFFPATLLTEVTDEMSVARNEVFGPVVSILTYDGVNEVIGRANDTPYGLAAYVYGYDVAMCRAIASRIEAGIVGVNEWRPLKAEIPFGGMKQSGIGAEGGTEGIQEFLNTQVISLPKPAVESYNREESA